MSPSYKACTHIFLPEVWHWKYPVIEPGARQSSLPIKLLEDSSSLKHNSSGTRVHACVQSTWRVVWTLWFSVSWLLLFLTVDTWEFVSFVILTLAYRLSVLPGKGLWNRNFPKVRVRFALPGQPWRPQHLRKGRRSLSLLSSPQTGRRCDAFADLLSSLVQNPWVSHFHPAAAGSADQGSCPSWLQWELLGLHEGRDLK